MVFRKREKKRRITMKRTPYDWREKHPKCKFCRYCEFVSPSTKFGVMCPDYYKCEVKDRIIHLPNMPRPLCMCYEARHEAKFEKGGAAK